jgi:glycosyltransferase involved in cell wall biosynthesis
MKILHILSQRPDSTGSGYYLQNIIRLAEKAGHRNYLLAALPVGEELQLSGAAHTIMEFVRFNGGELNFPMPGMSDVMPYDSSKFSELTEAQTASYEDAFAEKIGNATKTFQPDIVHSHHLWVATAVARRVVPELPLVTTCHSTDLRQFMHCENLRSRVLSDCRKIDRILSLGRDQTEMIADLYGIKKNRIDIVGGGFNAELFFRVDKPVVPPVQILYAGKLSYAKGVDLLLDCCGRLNTLPFHLHLAGSGTGEEEAHCLKLAKELGADVTIHGRLDQHQLARLMGSSHLFILPSFFEGLPLVLLEALASGCRIITTDLPGCREVLAQADGNLVEFIHIPKTEGIDRPLPSDSERLRSDLAGAIKRMVQRILQEPIVSQSEIDKLISTSTWDSVFARIETTYRKVIKERSHKSARGSCA